MRHEIEYKLEEYLNACKPIIYVTNFDFELIDEYLESVTQKLDPTPIIKEYFGYVGVLNFHSKYKIIDYHGTQNILTFLNHYDNLDLKEYTILLLKDIHSELNKPEIISKIKSIATKTVNSEYEYKIITIIASSVQSIPPEIEKYITLLEIPLPKDEEIGEIIHEWNNLMKGNSDAIKFINDLNCVKNLKNVLRGLGRFEIRQILQSIRARKGYIEEKDIVNIREEKKELLKKSKLIELIPTDDLSVDIDAEIGGLSNLKNYLSNIKYIYQNINSVIDIKLKLPNGILLVGIPGCGKSLTAKCASKKLEAPLLRLDIGNLLGKYYGESEENMRNAIKLAEAASPCVLWIDEIEKAFSGIGKENDSHETTVRLFGHFLTWLQENQSEVFVIATSNNVDNLPIELLRKGRFDEIFFVDFPNVDEIKSIYKLHLGKINKINTNGVNISEIVKQSPNNMTGADIESVINEALLKCFIRKEEFKKNAIPDEVNLATQDILDVLKRFKSYGESYKDKVEKIKEKSKDIQSKPASEIFSNNKENAKDKVVDYLKEINIEIESRFIKP